MFQLLIFLHGPDCPEQREQLPHNHGSKIQTRIHYIAGHWTGLRPKSQKSKIRTRPNQDSLCSESWWILLVIELVSDQLWSLQVPIELVSKSRDLNWLQFFSSSSRLQLLVYRSNNIVQYLFNFLLQRLWSTGHSFFLPCQKSILLLMAIWQLSGFSISKKVLYTGDFAPGLDQWKALLFFWNHLSWGMGEAFINWL